MFVRVGYLHIKVYRYIRGCLLGLLHGSKHCQRSRAEQHPLGGLALHGAADLDDVVQHQVDQVVEANQRSLEDMLVPEERSESLADALVDELEWECHCFCRGRRAWRCLFFELLLHCFLCVCHSVPVRLCVCVRPTQPPFVPFCSFRRPISLHPPPSPFLPEPESAELTTRAGVFPLHSPSCRLAGAQDDKQGDGRREGQEEERGRRFLRQQLEPPERRKREYVTTTTPLYPPIERAGHRPSARPRNAGFPIARTCIGVAYRVPVDGVSRALQRVVCERV